MEFGFKRLRIMAKCYIL